MSRLVLNISTDLLKVPEGARLVLHDGRNMVVKENMGDGQWLNCTDAEGELELVHAQDIAEVHTPEQEIRMLRIGYMPSDFHPVLLVLGNHADLDRFSEILGQFSGDGRTREMGIDTDVHSTDTRVILARPESGRRYGLWPDEADGSQLHWTLTKEDAGAFSREVVDLSSSGAPAGSTTLECDILDELKVKVSIGEWEDHFLEDGGRQGDSSMIRNTVLIAGGGQAGASAAFRLRANGYDGEILIVCGENALPYQRPPLSKRYLIGSDGPDSLVLRPLEAYHKAGISLALGQCVVAINRDAASVTLDDGRILDFRHLILATGGSAVPLPASIAKGFANIHTFRSLADADLLGGQVGPARRMLIIGGGYIGLEMAAVARQSGMEVTVVEQAPRILQRVAALETADFFRDMHRARGVEILEGTRLAELTGADPLIADTACLEDGREISFDVAVVGIGIRPETGLAGAAGLRVEDGIVVDAHGRTDDKSIYAVGDCSNFPYKGGRLRLESVHNAIAQAEHAADVICGMDRSGYDPVPWFWSDQYDAKLQIAGLNKGYDQTIRRPGRREGGMSIWYFREGQFLAVDAINDPQAFMTGKRWLEASTCPPIERIADVTLDLKQVA